MSYDDICRRADWSMTKKEFKEFAKGGHFLCDSTLRDIICTLEPSTQCRNRRALDSTFLNHFQMILQHDFEAAAAFARSSPMGKCQDMRVDWIMPYCFPNQHWITIVISRMGRSWGIYDSSSGFSYTEVSQTVRALVKILEIPGEPCKDWKLCPFPTLKQEDGWSCGIHTLERMLSFLRGADSPLEWVDVPAARQEYFQMLVALKHPQALKFHRKNKTLGNVVPPSNVASGKQGESVTCPPPALSPWARPSSVPASLHSQRYVDPFHSWGRSSSVPPSLPLRGYTWNDLQNPRHNFG